MLADFLDKLGIAHKDGVADNLPATVEDAALKEAVDLVLSNRQLKLEIARRTTNSYSESLTVFSRRLGGGVASKLETDDAEGALASVAAQVPDLEQRIRLQENAIKVLLGQTSFSIPRGVPQNATS